jgi:hypothetical protein
MSLFDWNDTNTSTAIPISVWLKHGCLLILLASMHIVKCFIRVSGIDSQHSILGQIDSNTDGLVDFEEFVAATLHVHQLVEHDTQKWKSLSQAAFDKFDVDGDGYITSDELRMVCLRKLPELILFVLLVT